MYSTVLYGTVLVYSKCTYGGSTGGCPPWLNENIGGSKGGFPPWLKENIGGSTGGFPPWLNSRTACYCLLYAVRVRQIDPPLPSHIKGGRDRAG